jgi:hypothetical protein
MLIEQINAVRPQWDIAGFFDDGMEVDQARRDQRGRGSDGGGVRSAGRYFQEPLICYLNHAWHTKPSGPSE